MPKIPFFNH